MIRINLLPTKKKAARASAAAAGRGGGSGAGPGQVWIIGMLIGWILIGGAAYWLLTMEEDAAAQLRQQAAAKTAAAEKIKQDIDEEGLEASKEELAMQEAIKDKLETKRRSPVFVMYELAMILTDAKDGGGPDIDKEKLARLGKLDAQVEPNPRWDPTGLWLTRVEEKEGQLFLEGGARDATDLSEFSRRLRVSGRFGEVSSSDYERVQTKGTEDEQHLVWTLDVAIRQWD